MKTYTYQCINPRCLDYRTEWRSMSSPSEYRHATGRALPCAQCGAVVRLVSVNLDEPDEGEGVTP